MKNRVRCNLCWKITSQFHSVNLRKHISCCTYLAQIKIGNLYRGLIWAIEKSKAILRYFYWIIFKPMDINSKCQISYSLKTTTFSHTIFTRLSYTMKQLLGKFNFELKHAFNYQCIWNKEERFLISSFKNRNIKLFIIKYNY